MSTEEILDQIEMLVRQLLNVENYNKIFFDIEITRDSAESNYGIVDNNNKVIYLDHARKLIT